MLKNNIFIFGCGHSGTTILNKIIINHKNIYGFDYEKDIFNKSKNDLTIINNFSVLNNDKIKLNKKFICIKTPTHVYFIDKIYKLFLNPKIIIIIRDGRDVVASLYERYNDFNKSVNRWINDNLEWINSKYNEDFHILKYENFIKDPELEIKKICEYLGEEYDSNMLNYEKKNIILPANIFKNRIDGEKHKLLRVYQKNQNIYDGSKRYLKDLTEEQLNQLYSNEKFMFLMKKFDYI